MLAIRLHRALTGEKPDRLTGHASGSSLFCLGGVEVQGISKVTKCKIRLYQHQHREPDQCLRMMYSLPLGIPHVTAQVIIGLYGVRSFYIVDAGCEFLLTSIRVYSRERCVTRSLFQQPFRGPNTQIPSFGHLFITHPLLSWLHRYQSLGYPVAL